VLLCRFLAIKDTAFDAFDLLFRLSHLQLGLTDAEILAGEFYPFFSARDLINLPNYHIYLKLMIDGAYRTHLVRKR
jgi:hypothetical protein